MQNEAAAAAISEIMEKLALFALDKGMAKIAADGTFTPFIIFPGDADEFITRELTGSSPQETYEAARAIIAGDTSIEAYAFCYDGYANANKSEVDAVISEFAERGDVLAYAACRLYCGEGDSFEGEEESTFLGECPTLFPTVID